jgi:diguanylate cyclase (GGDEF)-like protein
MPNENNLAVLSVKSLKYINYWNKGTQTGDEVLEIVSSIVKNNFTRKSDLNFKVGGADYLLSVDKTSSSEIKSILKNIKDEIQINPRLKKIVEEEKLALKEQINAASWKNDKAEISNIKQKMEQLNNFDFDFRFQVLGHSEIPKNASLNDILKQADDLFKAEETTH